MIQVVSAACEFAPDRSRGKIVIESLHGQGEFDKAFHELGEIEARSTAQSYAATQGVVAARINGNTDGPYPVNSEGVPLDAVKGEDGKALPPQHPRMQPFRYRLDVPVCQPLR